MKIRLRRPEHLSYRRHRRQVVTQIILPVALAFVMIGALIYVITVAPVGAGADMSRMAAISTMWILLPLMLLGLLLLAVLGGLVYLLALLLRFIPPYSGKAQDYAYKVRGYARRGSDLAVRPVLAIEGYLATVRAFFGKR